MSRLARALATLAMTVSLCAGVDPTPARAQEVPNPEGAAEGEGSGRPLDGYLATAAMAFLALFIVAKSARR